MLVRLALGTDVLVLAVVSPEVAFPIVPADTGLIDFVVLRPFRRSASPRTIDSRAR